jgi:hypothetical protein
VKYQLWRAWNLLDGKASVPCRRAARLKQPSGRMETGYGSALSHFRC